MNKNVQITLTKKIMSKVSQKVITLNFHKYRISSNKRRALSKYRTLISATPLGIHIEISAFLLISATPLNTALIRIVTIFY